MIDCAFLEVITSQDGKFHIAICRLEDCPGFDLERDCSIDDCIMKPDVSRGDAWE
jgi:hypothetical protein